nr:hypothetical protein [Chthoniobacterales bacterium]
NQHWLYVGRAGDDMAAALHLLFSAIEAQRAGNPDEWRKTRLHFVGTSYAPEGRAAKTVEPIAERCGVADMVDERTSRVPYFEALQTLKEADALLVIGSDSPSYSASKLYPYMLARRPMLSVLHEQSPAVEILRKCRAGEVVTFDPANVEASAGAMRSALETLRRSALRTSQRSLREAVRRGPEPDGRAAGDASQFALPALNWDEFKQYTAREMTRRMCEVFDRAISLGATMKQSTDF